MTPEPSPMRTPRRRERRPPGFREGPTNDAHVAAEREPGSAETHERRRGAELPDLHNARTQSVFTRAPEPLPRWLAHVVFELQEQHPRVTRQDLVSALLLRYVRPGDTAARTHLLELLDDLERARAPR